MYLRIKIAISHHVVEPPILKILENSLHTSYGGVKAIGLKLEGGSSLVTVFPRSLKIALFQLDGTVSLGERTLLHRSSRAGVGMDSS